MFGLGSLGAGALIGFNFLGGKEIVQAGATAIGTGVNVLGNYYNIFKNFLKSFNIGGLPILKPFATLLDILTIGLGVYGGYLVDKYFNYVGSTKAVELSKNLMYYILNSINKFKIVNTVGKYLTLYLVRQIVFNLSYKFNKYFFNYLNQNPENVAAKEFLSVFNAAALTGYLAEPTEIIPALSYGLTAAISQHFSLILYYANKILTVKDLEKPNWILQKLNLWSKKTLGKIPIDLGINLIVNYLINQIYSVIIDPTESLPKRVVKTFGKGLKNLSFNMFENFANTMGNFMKKVGEKNKILIKKVMPNNLVEYYNDHFNLALDNVFNLALNFYDEAKKVVWKKYHPADILNAPKFERIKVQNNEPIELVKNYINNIVNNLPPEQAADEVLKNYLINLKIPVERPNKILEIKLLTKLHINIKEKINKEKNDYINNMLSLFEKYPLLNFEGTDKIIKIADYIIKYLRNVKKELDEFNNLETYKKTVDDLFGTENFKRMTLKINTVLQHEYGYGERADKFRDEMKKIIETERKESVKMLPIVRGEELEIIRAILHDKKNIIELKPVNFKDYKSFLSYFYDLFRALYLKNSRDSFTYAVNKGIVNKEMLKSSFTYANIKEIDFSSLDFSNNDDIKSWTDMFPNIEKIAKEVHKLLKDFKL